MPGTTADANNLVADTKPASSSASSTGKKQANPFAVPDNEYRDSFLDSLWINLFASRMSAAVEAESYAASATPPSKQQQEQWPAAAAAAAASVRRRRAAATGATGAATGPGPALAESLVDEILQVKDVDLKGTPEVNGDKIANMELPGGDDSFKKQQLIGAHFGAPVSSARASSVVSKATPAANAVPAASVRDEQMPMEGAQSGADSDLGDGGTTFEGGADRITTMVSQSASESVNKGGARARVGETGMSGAYTYEDYVNLATKLQAGPPERQRQVVRGVLLSIFPRWFPAFYRTLFPSSKVGVFLLYFFPLPRLCVPAFLCA